MGAERNADQAYHWSSAFAPTIAAIAESLMRVAHVLASFVVESFGVVAIVVVESAPASVALPVVVKTVESVEG